MKVKFIRKGGRIIPIKINEKTKDVASFVGASLIAGNASMKARKEIGVKGFVNQTLFDLGATTGALYLLNKKFKSIGKGYQIFNKAMKGK